ncbi:MAG: tRNA pseudouridine(55) synthase TruB [Bacteroidales bacterium]|nr:tRNA pseudouridine(55) synthase TruB [Bacteroidales bacterium]
MNFIEGEILYIDKPLTWTSFRLVKVVRAKLRNRLQVKKLKVGHAGTLDPLATGVMVVCTGRKTKEIERLQAGVKGYTATIRLGATTPSFDLETEVDAEYPTDHITEDMVREALKNFVGEIEQIPPNFSAIKVNGKRAYDLARKNVEFELKPRLLVIDSIVLVNYEMPYITISVVCSKGTYIRSLARDIGESLESGGHLTSLVRTRVGDATLEKCLTVDELDDFFEENI